MARPVSLQGELCGALRRLCQHSASSPSMLGVRDGYQNDAACTAVRAVRCPIVDGGTQSMPLSAAIKQRLV